MNKSQIISFFDRHAPGWDANIVTDDIKINRILDAAGIKAETTVLDVACGTGVLFPYYLERSVPQVTGVDISSEMIRIASGKIQDERIRAICGDMETIPISGTYDCAVVYNAFPHFEEPKRLIERLSLWVKPGGRFTVAHSMGLKELARHHMREVQKRFPGRCCLLRNWQQPLCRGFARTRYYPMMTCIWCRE